VKPEAPSKPGFALEQTFFGFKPEDRVKLHENIFDLIWWGDGRWDWDTIYHMPIHIRKFWIKKLNKMIEDEQTRNHEKAEAAKRQRNVISKKRK
jgi:hypothetical protein